MKELHYPNSDARSAESNGHLDARARIPAETAFGHPMDFLGNRFVYVVVSPRARGLSIGVNMNPDRKCNFECVYCEVNHRVPARERHLHPGVMVAELHKTFALVQAGRLRERPWYCTLPAELLQLRHVTLSGDGEPTLAPNFAEVVEAVFHVRAVGQWPFFKIVLVTNATGLDQPQVQEGLSYFSHADEIWAKLDGGTQAYLNGVNRPEARLEKILENILAVARRRPVVIQSLFPAINGVEPAPEEIEQYVQRLNELKLAGAQISLVQIYSATRPAPSSACGHLPLKALSRIVQAVRQSTGLRAEVF